MFALLKLFLLEFRLQHHLGKYDAYRNAVHDQGGVLARMERGGEVGPEPPGHIESRRRHVGDLPLRER